MARAIAIRAIGVRAMARAIVTPAIVDPATVRVIVTPAIVDPDRATVRVIDHRDLLVIRRADGRPGDTGRRWAVAVLLVFAAAGVRASTNAEALGYFSEAKVAFERAEYSRARALFERALAAGMEGPAIHYNIGASAYRAGDLPRAERAFREVANTPTMAALAYYNLGLVALDRRDEREARDWFRRVTEYDGANERLVTVANHRLDELPRRRAAGAWSWYARGGGGYDDNVALRSESVESSATGEEDSYRELTFATSYSFGAWRLDAGAGLLDYTKLDDFSQRSLYLGGARGLRLGAWHLELGAHGTQLSFGGDVYERNVTAGLMASRVFDGGSRLRAQLRRAKVDGQGLFTGLTGDRTELGVYYDTTWRAWYLGAHTRGEINDSEDSIFAPRYVQIGAEARYSLTPLWALNLGAALRRTSRPTETDSLDGWDDDRLALQVGATRALWKQAQLYMRYDVETNDSPVPGFDYDRNRATVSIEFWY